MLRFSDLGISVAFLQQHMHTVSIWLGVKRLVAANNAEVL
jgi:hypothetical protein